MIEFGVYAGPAAHAAGFVKRDIFELESGGLFGHEESRVLSEESHGVE